MAENKQENLFDPHQYRVSGLERQREGLLPLEDPRPTVRTLGQIAAAEASSEIPPELEEFNE